MEAAGYKDFLVTPKSKTITDDDFVALIKGYEKILYKMAFQYVKNESDALDMVAEAVYRGYKNRRSLKNEEFFRSWITRILITTCLNFLKRSKRIVLVENEIFDSADNSGQTANLENSLLLEDALSRLEMKYKTVILFRYYMDLSIKETAKTMKLPENTVKTYTARALKQLKTILKEDLFYE